MESKRYANLPSSLKHFTADCHSTPREETVGHRNRRKKKQNKLTASSISRIKMHAAVPLLAAAFAAPVPLAAYPAPCRYRSRPSPLIPDASPLAARPPLQGQFLDPPPPSDDISPPTDRRRRAPPPPPPESLSCNRPYSLLPLMFLCCVFGRRSMLHIVQI
jgi:hypothetical protein